MIPSDIDLHELSKQINDDQIALESSNPKLHTELESAITYAQENGFGSVGIAILDSTPAKTADLRDIAQELLITSHLDTVIVRAPSSGAIVSTVHNRADIESAQWHFLANPNYAEATTVLVDHINAEPVPGAAINILTAISTIFAIAIVVFFNRS
ncbi:1-deoxy-D-xylulose-5-phosphate synthase [Corynebacterium kutscheri]|uniref:1-deoxy-D-xylulose-5-phosphate synthase n=1 Tax=Corynebacterium kutscheri TaxID=35755 RepID=A0A0F6R1U6_9CORY|nr:DUF6676 family protein [Corynebacterium kutscheri]AKE41248.1 hypothetical protein UL82_05365 [Corynebacterium kutscheri]VEH08524.1 1-deoxy-D-xylulose-5-phosphate synthase [Corynebacterium kutscheri]VEH09570.1 1-deoxy-D-xylulose-5-phosphate synthase [Corynebacterium kutscheri]VEH79653.1 1-deoxy-D-xylulose-5-phosphate synthase [Corynebacterium kutscheri]